MEDTWSTLNGAAKIKGEDIKPLVSLVTPAFNEEAVIEGNLNKLCGYMNSIEHKCRWELIIVNDGSTDSTGDIAEAFARDRANVHVLHHMYNFRLGQALRYAFSHCQGEYIIVMDSDLSYSPDHIEKLLDKIIATRAKIVIASPYRKGGRVSNVPWMRKMLSIWANRFLSLTVTRDRFSDRLTTLTGMVRAYDRKFLSHLNLKAMDVDIMPEIIYKAMIQRARIVEIPAHLNWTNEKTGGQKRRSSLLPLKTIISSLIYGFIFRPFMFFILPGFGLIILALYPLGWAFVHTFTHLRAMQPSDLPVLDQLSHAIAVALRQSPQSFIVGGIALMVAIQLVTLGSLALQNKKYFEELFHLASNFLKSSKEGHEA